MSATFIVADMYFKVNTEAEHRLFIKKKDVSSRKIQEYKNPILLL